MSEIREGGAVFEGQPRVPGVKYRKVKRFRQETTVIDGVPETDEVPYFVWEPLPPTDWDVVLLRGVTVASCVTTVLTVAGSVAAIGGVLSLVIDPVVAYSVAFGFDVTWLGSMAVQHLERTRPARAKRAKAFGWFALILTMAAIVAYGISLDHWVAGAVAASVPLMNKGFLSQVMGAYEADLPKGTAFWMQQQMARSFARAAVAKMQRRLDRHQAYMLAAFGPEGVARADAATTAVVGQVPGQIVSGQVSGRVSGPPVPPAPKAPVPSVSAPVTGHVSTQVTSPAAPVPGHADTVSASVSQPVSPPVSQPVSAAAASDPSGHGVPASSVAEGHAGTVSESVSASAPAELSLVGVPSIASIIKAKLAVDPEISNADLTAAVAKIRGESDSLAASVKRTRARITDPNAADRRRAADAAKRKQNRKSS